MFFFFAWYLIVFQFPWRKLHFFIYIILSWNFVPLIYLKIFFTFSYYSLSRYVSTDHLQRHGWRLRKSLITFGTDHAYISKSLFFIFEKQCQSCFYFSNKGSLKLIYYYQVGLYRIFFIFVTLTEVKVTKNDQ